MDEKPESPVQALSISIDNHLEYRVGLFTFSGDPPIAKLIRVISEGQTCDYAYFEDKVIPRVIKLAAKMNVFFVLGLRVGDSISKLAEQVLKDSL